MHHTAGPRAFDRLLALGAGLALLTLAVGVQAQPADCNQAAPQAITQTEVPGRPFAAVPSADGCTVFVSLTAPNGRGGLAVLARGGGSMAVARVVSLPGQVTGLALSRDGQVLAAANGRGLALLSTEKLKAGADDALLTVAGPGAGAGSIYVAFSPDNRLLYLSNERANSLGVYDYAAWLPGKPLELIGQIRTGGAPVGLALSPTGRWLYSTSEVGSGDALCPAEGRGRTHPAGMLMVVDVARSASDPAGAVLARVPAGCNPVRVAVSPAGDRVYVTARGSHALQVFDADKLMTDASHALLASVPVGPSPVGLAATGNQVFVANSDRFSGRQQSSLSVVDANHPQAAPGQLSAGGFPRELKLTPDGKRLLVTLFEAGSVELIDLERLGALAAPDGPKGAPAPAGAGGPGAAGQRP